MVNDTWTDGKAKAGSYRAAQGGGVRVAVTLKAGSEPARFHVDIVSFDGDVLSETFTQLNQRQLRLLQQSS